jgi:hypothetical protein
VNSISQLRKYFFHGFIPLILGCLLYIIGRPIANLNIGSYMGLHNTAFRIKLPIWLSYNAPDGLWLYSFLMCLILIWQSDRKPESFVWFFSLITATFLSELLQKFSIIHGSFDIYDMLAYLIALLLCTLNYFQFNNSTK